MEVKRDQEEYKHVCRLCNKKYPSGKSLGGHMRSHVLANSYVPLHKLNSKKSLTFCNSNGNHPHRHTTKGKRVENLLVAGDGDISSSAADSGSGGGGGGIAGYDHSDKKSAKEERYRAIALIDSFSLQNACSSNDSEIGQEEVALWLMMLSRDSGHRVGFSFTTESSDTNSVTLEGKFSSKRKHLNSLSTDKNRNANGSVRMKKVPSKKVNCLDMDSSDSGYFENGAKEVDSDDSVDGYAGNYGIKNPIGKCRSDNTSIVPMEDGDESGNQAQLKKYLKKEVRACGKKMRNDHLSSTQAPSRSPRNAGKYRCSICERTFKTHQALGGHIITHKRDTNDAISGFRDRENGENSSWTSNFAAKSISKSESRGVKISSKKSHCCPFCPKVFKSGQALGGHKRSHLICSSSQDKANTVGSIDENPPRHPHLLLDLNLPPSSVE